MFLLQNYYEVTRWFTFIKFGEKQLNLLRPIKPAYKYFFTLLSGFNIHTGILFAFFINFVFKLPLEILKAKSQGRNGTILVILFFINTRNTENRRRVALLQLSSLQLFFISEKLI